MLEWTATTAVSGRPIIAAGMVGQSLEPFTLIQSQVVPSDSLNQGKLTLEPLLSLSGQYHVVFTTTVDYDSKEEPISCWGIARPEHSNRHCLD